MAVAKPLMSEVFCSTLPEIVTPKLTSTFVVLCSLGSLIGRILWAYLSDYVGRKQTFAIMTTIGAGIFFSFPLIVS